MIYKIDGVFYAPIKVRTKKCPDCGQTEGNNHLEFCDQEHCPKCGRQLLTCDCDDIQQIDDEEVAKLLNKKKKE